jgi:thiol-disulfide isomerase/thioredoxin
MKLLILFVIFSFSIGAEQKWNTWDEGVALAKDQKRPILVDVYTDWCKYCKVLEEKVFPDPNVEKELGNYVTIRVNGDEFPEIVERYRIQGYPTILFLDKNGALLDKLVGLPDTNHMKNKLVEVFAKRNLEEDLLQKQSEQPDLQEINYKLGIYYLRLMDFPKSIDYFLKTYNSKIEILPERKRESLYILGILNIQEKKYSESVSLWTLYIQEYPDTDISIALYYRAVSNFHMGKMKVSKEDFLKCKEMTNDEKIKSSVDSYLVKMNI